ncbi:hypothetical protein [Derxia lacustris]|uniref:hypothetical protein n=1 Tax=Derxia lacustris TaxID=764842 RepID=UPI000A16D587|nr:hypothetical protein [Derxia lacustris]
MGCCTGYNFAPAPDAALDPAQRVNFSFGMVLGVDDFRQEHAYLAARDERALRELIGYGAITGLGVSTAVTGTQVEVRIAPGLALLPDGKLVGVAVDQCARLDEWLAGPGKEGASGKTGAASVYVVLRAVEVTGTPVPIPGEPCRDEDSLVADSRIADSFALDFAWTPPAQTEDAALRTFAAWLRRVEVRDAPVPAPELADFQAAVETQVKAAIANAAAAFANPPLSATPAPDPDPQPDEGPRLVIPRERYAEFIAAAFDVWTRRLRADAMAHFGPVPAAEDTAEAGLLLAAIDIALDAGNLQFPAEAADTAVARWLGRAELVHLRLLQEWLITNVENDAPREATYVLGRFDARLPNAQALDLDFSAHDHALTRIDFIDAPTLDDPTARKAVLHPAVKWPGTADSDVGGPDYYGPGMSAPIPVSDGGTGQSAAPERGQLLVGVPVSDAGPAHFELGRLVPVTHTPTGTDALTQNLVVDVDSAAPDILIDTVQNLGPLDSPEFAGLTVTGALAADSLAVTGDGSFGGTLAVTGDASLGSTLAVTGDATVGGALAVTGATSLGGELAVTGAASVGGGLAVTGDESVGGTLSVTGATSLGSGVTVTGDIGASGALAVGTDASVGGALTLGTPLAPAQGGTGLATPPAPLQVLVGDPNAAGNYLLAQLVDSPTVSVNLSQIEASPPEPQGWQLSFNASGGSGLSLPITPAQGGTGQTGVPAAGQILNGDGAGGYAIGALRPARAGRHIAVAKVGDDLTVDTTPQTHWAMRVVTDMTKDNKLLPTDHVVVIQAEGEKLAFDLGAPEDQRVVIIKSLATKSAVTVVGDGINVLRPNTLIDNQASLTLAPQAAVTLIGLRKTQWLVIGRG